MQFRTLFHRAKAWLQGLSFRTGLIVLALCLPCYLLSFAMWLLPDTLVSVATKGVLWGAWFGLAKTFQYTGLTILGAEGWRRVKARFARRASGS